MKTRGIRHCRACGLQIICLEATGGLSDLCGCILRQTQVLGTNWEGYLSSSEYSGAFSLVTSVVKAHANLDLFPGLFLININLQFNSLTERGSNKTNTGGILWHLLWNSVKRKYIRHVIWWHPFYYRASVCSIGAQYGTKEVKPILWLLVPNWKKL